jgi:hypothetical protein
MKIIFFIYLIIVTTITIMLFSSCVKEPVTGITLNEDYLFVPPGSTVTLIATVQPENATKRNVTWSSDNPKIAKVNSNGKVVAITEGNTTITVSTKDGNYQSTCKIVVDKSAPQPSDYRAKWVGTYDCTKRFYGGFDQHVKVSVIALGDSLLHILDESKELDKKVEVKNDGSFLLKITNTRTDGYFFSDSIYVRRLAYSAGGSTTIEYQGKKIKN